MLNYHHLYYFHRVARGGSIAAASRELGLTQPTISEQIRLLEKSLGHKLFDRVGRSLVLTDIGRTAFAQAEQIFALGEELKASLAGQPARHKLRVRIDPEIPATIAAQVLKRGFAQAELEFTADRPELTLSLNAEGEKLFDCGTVLLAPKKRAKIERVVVPAMIASEVGNFIAAKKLSLRILTAPNAEFAFALAGVSNAACAVPDFERPAGFQVMAHAERIRWRVYATTRARRPTHPAIRAILGR